MELACPGVGFNAPRRCTDKPCLLLYLLSNIALVAIAIIAYSKGDIDKILKGTDYNGNVCGKGYPANMTISQAEWQSRTLLWYPFSWDSTTHEFRITSALDYGICVSECNPASSRVNTYGGNFNANGAQSFAVLYDSAPVFDRCLPNFKTFDCPAGQNCTQGAGDSNGDAERGMGFTGFFFGLLSQVYSSLWITVLFFLLAIILCFVWLIILRRAVKPVVSVVILLVFVVGAAVVFVLAVHYKNLQNDAATKNSDDAKFALAIAVIAGVLLFLYVCVMLYLRKSIMISCDIIEEGSKIIVDFPSIMFVPLWTAASMFGYLLLFAGIAVQLYTIGDNEMITTRVENSFGQMVTVTAHRYNRARWVDYCQVFNFFMMLWVLAYQNGVAYMTISMTGVVWFFSAPGNNKDTSKSPVCQCFGQTQRYHGGTIAFGTLLFSIIAFARIALRFVEKWLIKTSGNNNACCLLICCAKCCLACLDRIVRFLTEHGFVMTAMTGAPLLTAAREGVSLLTSTPAVLSINLISDVILAVSRILIVVVITLCGVAALHKYASSHDTASVTVAACSLLLAVGTWFIAGVFTRVLTVCIDTTLLCFCYDARHHNGQDRPYYAPDDLKAHLHTASKRIKSKDEDVGLLNKSHV